MRSLLRALIAPALAVIAATSSVVVGTGGTTPAHAAVSAREGAVRLSSSAMTWAPMEPSLAADVGVDAPFRLATFNVLGHSHTARGGNKARYADSRVRMARAVHRLRQHRVDVVGFQELQRRQARAFERRTHGAFALWSGSRDTENSIAWRKSAFSFVEGTTQAIPYFGGRTRRMPVVLLRSKVSGQEIYFVNVHNPAHRRSAYWREVALAREVALVRQLRSHGAPVLVTGDLNERDRAFCRLTGSGELQTPAGGSNDGTCRPPAYGPVDWIFTTPGVGYSGFTVDRATRLRRISDHPMVVARVR